MKKRFFNKTKTSTVAPGRDTKLKLKLQMAKKEVIVPDLSPAIVDPNDGSALVSLMPGEEYTCPACPAPATMAGLSWIDDFNGDSFGPITAPLGSADAGVSSNGDPRTIDAQSSGANTSISINSGNSIGAFSHSQDSGVLGLSQVDYDLGGLDLTVAGTMNAFRVGLNSIDLGGFFGVIVDGVSIELSSSTVLLQNNNVMPSVADILFSDFFGVDFTSVNSLSLFVDGSTTQAFDVSFNMIGVVCSGLNSSGGSGAQGMNGNCITPP